MMHTLPADFSKGGYNLTDGTLHRLLQELRGYRIDVVTGAAAGTKMNLAGIRNEDTIVAALVEDATSGVTSADDKANITIQSVAASGTLTGSVGNPAANGTFVVDGTTYTFKAAADVVRSTDVAIKASYSLTMDEVAARVNAYQVGTYGQPRVVASSNGSGVVTITAYEQGAGNAPTVSDTGSTITVSSTDPGAVTATCASVGNGDALTVNGVTFTARTSPSVAYLDRGVKATDALQAADFATAIREYQQNVADLGVVATASGAVITIRAAAGRTGNTITLSENATNVAASGSGYLAGGTNTGGLKSTTDLTGKTLIVHWYDKNP